MRKKLQRLVQEIKTILFNIGAGDIMGLYATIWGVIFLGAVYFLYQSNRTGSYILLCVSPIPIFIFTVITKLIVDWFARILPTSDELIVAKIDAERYLSPVINSKAVGILIKNLERYDLTDVY